MTSLIYPSEIILDDDSPEEMHDPDGKGRGLHLARRSTPYGQMFGATAFPTELIVPKSEIQARIKEMEERKSRTSDIINLAGLPCKDQSTTSLCWANAPTHCTEIIRVVQNQPMVILSPASVAGPINGFQNEGGWGEQALKQIINGGACPVEFWAANAIDKHLYTEENKARALDYRITEWWELVPKNMDQLVSCLLMRIPVAIGLNWWGHEVTAVDVVWLNGTIGIRIRNSWGMDWPKPGGGGYAILQGSKMYADDAVAPRVAIAA